jgi:hypothetical protein
VAYIKIDMDSLFAADWENQGERTFKQLVADVQNNDVLLEKELKGVQSEGQKILGTLENLVKQVQQGKIPRTAYPAVLQSVERFKRELAEQVANAQSVDEKFTAAMTDFRQSISLKQGTITESYATRIGKLRTLSSDRAKIATISSVKLREDYTKRLSALSKLLKVLIAQEGQADEVAEKKAASLVEKLKGSVEDATSSTESLLKTCANIEKYAKSKDEKIQRSTTNWFSGLEKDQKLYNAHAKTAAEIFDALKKIPNAQVAPKVEAGEVELDKLKGHKKTLKQAYDNAAKAVSKAELKEVKTAKLPNFTIK